MKDLEYSFEFLGGTLEVRLSNHSGHAEFIPTHSMRLEPHEREPITIADSYGDFSDLWEECRYLQGAALDAKKKAIAKKWGEEMVLEHLFAQEELVKELYDDIDELKNEKEELELDYKALKLEKV